MYQGGAFAKCLYLVGYPKPLLPFHSHRALLWLFKVAGKKLDVLVFKSSARF